MRVTVTTTADVADGDTSTFAALSSQPGADGAISLREAILASNAMTTTAALTIAFNIPADDAGHDSATGTWKLTLGDRALPPLARGGVTIDGKSQPGNPGRPQIVIDGTNVYEDPDQSNGITITSDGNTIRGLTLTNFYDKAMLISGPNAAYNRVVGCYLGPDGSGGPPAVTSSLGVELRDGAHDNTIGGADAASRNLISGNEHSGVLIQNETTYRNTVAGNWIGADATGQAALRNAVAGVMVSRGAHDNLIGGAGQGNLISGNEAGVYIEGGAANTVAGNIIGLAADGRTPLPNTGGGIFLRQGAHDNLIGGLTDAARNIISGNGGSGSLFGQGIFLLDADTAYNTIQGNYIGVDVTGNGPAGNYREGVLIGPGAHNNRIGGTASGARNVIAYNGLGGVRIEAADNELAGNLIGMGADGATQLGNQFNGVRVGGDSNTIGPDNVIANNQHSGIMISGRATSVLSNTIEANARSGICAAGPDATIRNNQIERNGAGSGPWFECPIRGGVVITGTTGLLVSGNRILSNSEAGVTVFGGDGNRISDNSISDNSEAGIRLTQGGNNDIAPPRLTSVSETAVSGYACAGCRVEVFADASDEGMYFVGATTADIDGGFRLALARGALPGPHVTATHTDAQGNTSPFAPAVSVSDPNPQPPPTQPRRIYLPVAVQ